MRKSDVFVSGLTVPATWNGQAYDCIRGGVDRSRRQFSETALLNTTSTARFWLADFGGTEPVVGDIITIDSTEYRVLESHRFEPFIKYALGNKYGRK